VRELTISALGIRCVLVFAAK
jgi:hypothetical protein